MLQIKIKKPYIVLHNKLILHPLHTFDSWRQTDSTNDREIRADLSQTPHKGVLPVQRTSDNPASRLPKNMHIWVLFLHTLAKIYQLKLRQMRTQSKKV